MALVSLPTTIDATAHYNQAMARYRTHVEQINGEVDAYQNLPLNKKITNLVMAKIFWIGGTIAFLALPIAKIAARSVAVHLLHATTPTALVEASTPSIALVIATFVTVFGATYIGSMHLFRQFIGALKAAAFADIHFKNARILEQMELLKEETEKAKKFSQPERVSTFDNLIEEQQKRIYDQAEEAEFYRMGYQAKPDGTVIATEMSMRNSWIPILYKWSWLV